MRLGLCMTLFLHWSLLALSLVQSQGLYRPNSPLTYLFWAFASCSLVLCLLISYRNPGYCSTTETTIDPDLPNECKRSPPTNIVPLAEIVSSELCPELQLSENPLQGGHEGSVQLELSVDASSSCKEHEFQAIADPVPSPVPVSHNPPEIAILLPSAESVPQVEMSIQATIDTRERDIPLRYCPICNIDQRLRSKHCLVCKRCIARYDHHCPWLSTCIGEKNHFLFIVYLYCQILELTLGIAAISYEVTAQNSGTAKWLGTALIVFASCVFLLLLSLTSYQTWLVCVNLTTWEHRSWKKVSYLQTRKKGKSPFTKGCFYNIRAFCRSAWRHELTDWKATISEANYPNS